jgi:AraC family transcriptional regulator
LYISNLAVPATIVGNAVSLPFLKFGVEIQQISAAAGVTEVPPQPYHRLLIHQGPPVLSRGEVGGLRQDRIQSEGDIDIVPTGLDGIWHDEDNCELWRVCLSQTLLVTTASDAGVRYDGLEPKLNVRDPALVTIVSGLEGALKPSDRLDVLYIESLATALATRVISLGCPPFALGRSYIFSIREQKKLVDFVKDSLGRDLSLSRTAALMGVSVSQFTKRFRHTFGLSFHQYVIHCRVERAATMLQSTALAPSEVAYACGFTHQSHMASAMRKILGVTPSELVREK